MWESIFFFRLTMDRVVQTCSESKSLNSDEKLQLEITQRSDGKCFVSSLLSLKLFYLANKLQSHTHFNTVGHEIRLKFLFVMSMLCSHLFFYYVHFIFFLPLSVIWFDFKSFLHTLSVCCKTRVSWGLPDECKMKHTFKQRQIGTECRIYTVDS